VLRLEAVHGMWNSMLALAVTAQAVAADAGACTAQLAIARDAYEQRAYARARAAFAAAITPCGMTPALLLALAQAELLSGDAEAAIATLQRLESMGPLDVPAMKVRARALYLTARDREA